jgi:hypothetical protein
MLAALACHFDRGGLSGARQSDAAARPDGGGVDLSPFDAARPACVGGLVACPVSGAAPVIDGLLADWPEERWYELTGERDYVSEGDSNTSDEDLSARFALRYTASHLHVAVEVRDEVHYNPHLGTELWRGDSIQLGFDIGGNGGSAGYDATDDWEYGWSTGPSGLQSARWFAPTGNPATAPQAAVVRSEGRTRYEVALAAADLGLDGFPANLQVGFTLVVNEDDDQQDGRDGFLELSPGLAIQKQPGLFAVLGFAP